MEENAGIITMQGNPLTLIGKQPKIGKPAPDCKVLNNDLSLVRLSSFQGKVCVITSVPSLDTPVCDMEVRRFNKEAGILDPDVTILTITMDLPFAQKRWCGAAGVDKVITLSDHLLGSFGEAYGVLIKELRLLARAVFILDRDGILQYVQLVKEVADEPDYNEVLGTLKNLV